MIATIAAFGAGFCAAAFIVRHRDPQAPEPCYLNVAYELGLVTGEELHCLEALAEPPKLSRLAEEWQPDPEFQADAGQAHAAQIAYAKGRHNGWWMSAELDVLDEAYKALRDSA
jgi:hypothetical protein